MTFVKNPPRRLRSSLRTAVVLGSLPLLLVGPKHSGASGYYYATEYNGDLVAITKKPARTRDEGRGPEALRRYGRKASEYRPKRNRVAVKKAA